MSPDAGNGNAPSKSIGAAEGAAAAAEAHVALQNDVEKGNSPLHSFDPDASPTQKAAQVAKGKDQKVGSINKQEKQTERAIDVADPKGAPQPVPTIVIEDTDDGEKRVSAKDFAGTTLPEGPNSAEPSTEPAPPIEDDGAGEEGVPGALPGKQAYEIPDWYKVGWRQISGIDEAPLTSVGARNRAVLDLFLAEQFYGEWYHNAGIIIFAVLTSHFVTRFHLGLGWLFILLAVCNTYYSTSVQRFRRSARDDIQRELVKSRLASEHESAEWLNNFLDRFWRIYEPVLSATIVSTVDQILSQNTPAFLDSLRLSNFTLGNKAPRIDKVRTFMKTEDDIVMMDWALSFTPNDTSDMTEHQKKNKVNPKIALAIRVGKSFASAALPVLVEDIAFSGFLRIKLKLMTNFPHVQTVDITFVEKPVIDFVLKPIGGDTFGFDIANLPGLSTFIRDMTHATLGPLMYDPNVFTLNLEQMLSGKPLDAAIGVVEVVVRGARNLQGVKLGGTCDPYVTLSINERAELAKTRFKSNTTNPTWMETMYILVRNLNESVVFDVFDNNDHLKNTKLSSASFELSKLLEDATQDDIISPLLKDGKNRGELRFDLHYFPVVEPELGEEEVMDSTVGIVRLVLHQAKELDQTKSLSGDLNPFAKVYLNHSTTSSFQTPIFKHTNSPVWESPYEFLCIDKGRSVITVKIVDERDFLKDPVIGYMSISLEDLILAKKLENRDWFPLSGCKQGKMRVTAEWKPLSMAGALHGSNHYKPPIGVVRLVLEKAVDVKNVEAMLGGKSDPYVRVQVENVTKGRTEIVNNNLNPFWDQIIYIPIHSLRESMMLECMDYQNLTKDRPIGSTELAISELAVPAPEDTRYPYRSNGVKAFQAPLRQEGGNVFKGTLHYTAEFIPALALKNVKFESDQEMSNFVMNRHDEDDGVVDEVSSSEEEDVPAEITIKSKEKKKKVSLKNRESKESVGSVHTSHTSGTNETGSKTGSVPQSTKESEKGIEMSTEELLAQQSGVIVFHVISGELQKKVRLEVLLDDGYWPCFSTVQARSTHAQWGYVGEGFVKEVDFGRVWLRLNESDDRDDIISEWKGDVKEFLQNTLSGPKTYEMKDKEDKVNATVTIESRYVPVPVKLDAKESINNQGILRIDLLHGNDIPGVDRSGKSDPYAIFTLNDQKVYKSQTKKKTVAPEWNEHFEISVPSRVAADFSVELFDWNQLEQAKSLGVGNIDLARIEPFLASEQIVKLSSNKYGQRGQVRLRLVFQPEIIAKSRKATSTFSTAGRTMTSIGGLPVTAGKGVLSGVAGVFKQKENRQDDVVASVPAGQAVGTSDGTQISATNFPSSENVASGTTEPGTLNVTVVDAKDLSQNDIKPYVTVRVGEKEFKTKHTQKTMSPEWNESFVFATSSLTPKLFVWIHDHKTIGKDKDVGEAEVDIWRHVKPQGVSSAEVMVELKQGGLLRLRLEFDSSTQPDGSHPSLNGEPGRRSISVPSPSRFNLRNLRHGGGDHDDS